MRNSQLTISTLALAAAALVATSARPAHATIAPPTGCCCIAGASGQTCTETTEAECLAKQQAAPQYDASTGYDAALKKSQAQGAGTTKSGWTEGKCATK